MHNVLHTLGSSWRLSDFSSCKNITAGDVRRIASHYLGLNRELDGKGLINPIATRMYNLKEKSKLCCYQVM